MGEYKNFNFPHFHLVGSRKSGGREKVCLYKFTHTPLLKNDDQLIQKSDKQPKKKKSNHLIY